MRNLFDIGRVFFGTAITGLGLLTVYYGDFPYMMIPTNHSWIPAIAILAGGSLLVLAGLCIVTKIGIAYSSLILGGGLLMIFVFYFVPYQFIASANYSRILDWENALKELALAGGAFVVAQSFPGEKRESSFCILK